LQSWDGRRSILTLVSFLAWVHYAMQRKKFRNYQGHEVDLISSACLFAFVAFIVKELLNRLIHCEIDRRGGSLDRPCGGINGYRVSSFRCSRIAGTTA
jgi:hypothetical protein